MPWRSSSHYFHFYIFFWGQVNVLLMSWWKLLSNNENNSLMKRSNWECRTRCWVYFDLISFLSPQQSCLSLQNVFHKGCPLSLLKNIMSKTWMRAIRNIKKEECFGQRKLRYWNCWKWLFNFLLSLGYNWKLLQLLLLLIANIFHHLNKHQQQEQWGRRKELTSGTKRSWRDDKKI